MHMSALVRSSVVRVLVASLAVVLLATACGDDDSEEAQPPPPAPAPAPTEAPAPPPPEPPPPAPTEAPAPPPAPTEAPAEKPVYGMVTAVQHPYYAPTEAAVGPTCERLGCEVIFLQPSSCDAAEESQLIRDVLARGIDGLGVSACDAAGVLPVVEEAAATGIPIVTFDADCCADVRTIAVSNSDQQIGELHAVALNDLLPDGGKVVNIVGSLAMENVRTRLDALADGINPNIEIENFEDQNDLTKTGQIIRDVLTTQGDEVDIFLTQTGSAAVIAQTLVDEGFDHIPVVGINDFEDILEWVRKGNVVSTVALNPGAQGELALVALDKLRQGLTPSVDFFGTGGVIITPENVDTYADDLADLNARLREEFEALWS
jgi:ribose transport system substrate-binding protein